MYPTPRADQFTIADLRANADIIEEKTDNVTYLGFCKPGTEGTIAQKKAMPIWSIMKIESSGIVKPITTTFLWPRGLVSFCDVWNDRDALDYQLKNM